MKNCCFAFSLFLLLLSHYAVKSQSPGLIVRPAGGNGVTALNPNGDGYCSATTAGYTLDDIVESEIPFKIVPAAITEPTGDLLTGPSAGFTDIVTRVDGSGFYLYKNASNIFFRLRIGGIISGSKGYSVLIDTDGKMGASGPYADPNYVAPSGNSPGNPGFEYEVVLQTNFQVAVYNIDGTATPSGPTTYPLSSNAQISVALSTDSNNPDYFYDWYVPLTAIGSPASIRTAVTTVTSPNSSLQGTRSDIYGINDGAFANTSAAWQTVVNAQPAISLSSFTGVTATCTAAPTINGPIAAGTAVTVSGGWTRLDASKPGTATITLFKNGVSAGTTVVTSGSSWSVIVPTIASGDVFYAKAQGLGESQCLQSSSITASGCTVPPTQPVLTCGSLKGISGTMPSTLSGNTVQVYLVPAGSASPFSNQVSTGVNVTYPGTTSFAFYTNGCSGGTNNVASGTYMIVTQNNGCFSAPVYVCISSGSSGTPPPLSINALTVTQPLYGGATAINGSGASSGDILRLFINGIYQSTLTATGSSFSFSGLNLNTGDVFQIYSQTGTGCMTQSAVFTVSCYTQAPVINVNSSGNLVTGATTVSGTSAYPGASVQLYKGVSPSGVATGSAATVSASGAWTVTVPAVANGESYYAVQTFSACASASSAAASVLTAAACPTITGTYTDASSSVTGTMPSAFTGTIRLYLDGALIGSQVLSAATAWSISPAVNTLYYNGVLTATAQASGGTESNGCSNSSIVGCTSPLAPSISPVSSSIAVGSTVNFAVSNVAAGSWYAVQDNTGLSFATSLYRSTSSGFNLLSNPFGVAGTYNLKLTADALTGCPASFALASVTVSASLPLLLLDFNGNNTGQQLQFNWTTTHEYNVSHFELEESTNGNAFSFTAGIALDTSSSINHIYRYTQNRVLTGKTWFRLKIIDIDGKFTYSNAIVLLPAGRLAASAKVLPNPFSSSINILYTAPMPGSLSIALSDVNGQLLYQAQRVVIKGDNLLQLKNLPALPAGMYFLVLSAQSGKDRMVLKTHKVD